MFYVNPKAIASLYGEIFNFGQSAEAMYCFTDSMRPFVQGPFADESIRFFDKQGVTLLAHQARWSGAVQFVHAVARTGGAAESPLIDHVKGLVEAPVISYAPERSVRDLTLAPSYNNTWYAVAFSSSSLRSLPADGMPIVWANAFKSVAYQYPLSNSFTLIERDSLVLGVMRNAPPSL